MKAKLTCKDDTTNYTFNVNHEGIDYSALVYLNSRGKFIDVHIYRDEEDIGYEGTDGQIREDITTYLDENWDDLV